MSFEFNEITKTLEIESHYEFILYSTIPKDTKKIVFTTNDKIFYNRRKYKNKVNLHFDKFLLSAPKTLTHLTTNYEFNQNIDFLPQSLTNLNFDGIYFNQKINKLPKNLTHLDMSGTYFNQNVDKLPKNLTHLFFNDDFDQKINKLPKNITHLSFGKYFDTPLIKLPRDLISLSIFYYDNKINLHKNIKEIKLSCHSHIIDNLPEHIENIYIHFNDEEKYINNLPPTIKKIYIQDICYEKYLKIPFGAKVFVQYLL